MRLGVLGCGSIGTEVVKFAATHPAVESIHVFDVDTSRAQACSRFPKTEAATSGKDLLDACDFFVEAASQDAAREYLPLAIQRGHHCLVMSLGCLADDAFRESVFAQARANGVQLYLPSGAIAGIDGLKAGSLANIKSVTLVTTKPPRALGLEVDKWTVVFDGSARDAVARFPQNVNVAAALSLAGLGFDATRVQVVADPLATRNHHKIIIEGDFGRLRTEVENLPSPQNPKTSYLASLSAIATLKRVLDPVQLGA